MAGRRRSASYPILSDDGDPEDTDALSSEYSAFTDSYVDDSRDEVRRITSHEINLTDSHPLMDMSAEGGEEHSVKKRRKRITPNTKLKYRKKRRRSTVQDAFIESYKNTPHYVKEENSDNLLARARLRIFRGVDSLPVRLFGLLILLIDVVFVIVELSIGKNFPVVAEEAFQVLDLIFSAYFCIEVSLRIVGEGKVFFRRWFEVVDLVVIVTSTLLTIIHVMIFNENMLDKRRIFVSVSRLVIAGRIVRVFFWARLVYEHKSLARYFRSKVSQNKRRYVKDGFDLDLTYVTDRVIAMSFPSSGSQSLYRNSIQEVGAFLDKNHFGHYRVYNMCSEREYDTSYFHNQVQRVLIDDHNVPKFTDLVDFCEDAYTWLEAHEKNVIVVHCKGGKGRTGMMISAWLVRSGLFEAAGDSLAYFSDRRTDKSRGKKSQGVETPSQSRYVKYYEKLFTQMKGNLPPPVSLMVKQMTIHGLSGITKLGGFHANQEMIEQMGVGKGDGTDWSFEVFLMNDKVFKCSLLEPDIKHVQVTLDQQSDTMDLVFSETCPLIIADDVRFKFYCSTKTIPTGNDKCQFYFWFHTTFIENLKISLDRSELDNLQKSKTQRYYPVGFAIELTFEPSSIPASPYSIIGGDEFLTKETEL